VLGGGSGISPSERESPNRLESRSMWSSREKRTRLTPSLSSLSSRLTVEQALAKV